MKKLLMFIMCLLSFTILIGCNDINPVITTQGTTQTNSTITDQTSTSRTADVITTQTTTEINAITMTLNPGVDTVEVYSEFTDVGALAIYESSNLDVTVIENTVDTDVVGIYIIRYQAVYGALVNEIFRVVFVIDSTKPEMQLNPGIDTIKIGETWIDMGITVTDNYDTELTYSTEGSVDTNTVGTYIITYTVIDSSQNQSTITRMVNVIE